MDDSASGERAAGWPALADGLQRAYGVAARLSLFQLSLLIVAVALVLSLVLSTLTWRWLYGPIEEATLVVAAIVTILTATPLTIFMVYLIKRSEHDRIALGVTNDELERERAKQTAALDALQHARDEAHAANMAKTQFLANVSHELRTPLNAILGFSEMMRNEVLGPLGHEQYQDYMRDIHGSGEQLLQAINDILDVARIESGTFTLSEGWCDLGALSAAMIELTLPHAEPGGVAVRNALEPERGQRIWADGRIVKQMLINLLSNAVKFTPQGGEVVIDGTDMPDGGFELSVSDTGIGIAAEDQEAALASFSQVDNSNTREYQGTGLGLSLTRSLIELHGGTLVLESTPGQGTTVRLRFPAFRSAK